MMNTSNTKNTISIESLRASFRYDKETGAITTPGGKSMVSSHGKGRRRITHNGVLVAASSVAYALVHGEWPAGYGVIYKDGDTNNLRWGNMTFRESVGGVRGCVRDKILAELRARPNQTTYSVGENLSGLTASTISTAMTKLRNADKIHVSGVCSRSYALTGHAAFVYAAGPASGSPLDIELRVDPDVVERIINNEVLTRKGVCKKARRRAIKRIEAAKGLCVAHPVAGAEAAEPEDEDAWHKTVVERSNAERERLMSRLRSNRTTYSIFGLAATM